jgi:plastocyanin
VSVIDFAFQPDPITIAQGTTVTWTNNTISSTTHNVTADNGGFNPQDLSPGQQYSVTFTSIGNFRYYCRFHGGPGGQGMSGTINVVAATFGASW